MVLSLFALWIAPALAGEEPDVVDVNTHFSTVFDLPQKANITIVDPRIAGVRPMVGPHLQIYGVGKGETALHLQYQDGSGHTLTAVVKNKKPKGKPVATVHVGHSSVIPLDTDAQYAASGDKGIAFSSLMAKKFVHVVGVKEGLTDVVVQGPGGTSVQLVEVTAKPADLSAHPLLELAVGESTTVPLPGRPRAFSVANAGVAAARVDLNGTPTLVVTGKAPGTTDVVVTDSKVHYWSIRVK